MPRSHRSHRRRRRAPTPHRAGGEGAACGAPGGWGAGRDRWCGPVRRRPRRSHSESAAAAGRERGGPPAHVADRLPTPALSGLGTPPIPRAPGHPRHPPGAPTPRPAGGCTPSSPRVGPRPPLPGARSLPLPARPPPGRQPTACPRGRQEATCPRKECRAWRAGGGAGQGRAGQGRELPAGKVGERERAARALPGPPRRPCARPRDLTLSPPDTRAGRPAGLREPGAGGGAAARGPGRGNSARPGQPPPPSARPPAPPARRRGQAVVFPRTPPSRRRLWGPGGEQGAD